MTVVQPLTSQVSSISELGNYQSWFLAAENLLLDSLEEKEIKDNTTLDNISALSLQGDNGQHPTPSIHMLLNPHLDSEPPTPEATTELEKFLLKKIQILEDKLDRVQKAVDDINATEQTQELKPMGTPVEIVANKNLAFHCADVEKIKLVDQIETHSFWMSAGNENVPPQLAIQKGLPASHLFSQFLVGIAQ
jgi:hypothetical protein